MNRDKLEQDAMAHLQRGNTEKALDNYLSILRNEPKDRRIRQKVGELYLSLGRRGDAYRHLLDVARGMFHAGQTRAAAAQFKQLTDLSPDDHELRAELAGCFEELGRKQEAREAWEEAFGLAERRDPATAIAYARRVARLAPGEVPPKVRVAELAENNRLFDDAFDAWVQLGREARRFGRADEQGRFLERALKLRPDDMETLLSAAEARVTQGESRAALAHLQQAHGLDPRNVRLLALLGRALQGLGQLEKARKVWLQAARRHVEQGDRDARADALRRALECGEDPALRAELDQADAEAQRHRFRLDQQDWAQPVGEADTHVIVRARVLLRYGFPDKARQVLILADEAVKAGLAWKIHMAELMIGQGQVDEGVAILGRIRPPDAAASQDLVHRLEVLSGRPMNPTADPAPLPATREPTEEEIIDDEDTAGPRATVSRAPPASDEDPEARGDRLAAAGERAAAIAAYREALSRDPSNVDALRKVGELMTGSFNSEPGPRAVIAPEAPAPEPPTPEPPAPEPSAPEIPLAIPEDDEPMPDFGAFAEIDPEALDAVVDSVAEARALIEVGLAEEALDLLRGQNELESLVVQAMASRALGRLDGALGRLERAVQAGGDHHPGYVEALWELAGVYLLRRRIGNAERLLDEIGALDPAWRPIEMAARRRGIELLRQR